VRGILDAGGLGEATIFVSGNLDEHRVRELFLSGAPIDGYGIGTRMNTSADAPYLDCAYKLTEYAGEARRKRSEGKATWPGRKQVFRRSGEDGVPAGDTLGLDGEAPAGTPLLEPVMIAGTRVTAPRSLAEARAHARSQIGVLPAPLRELAPAVPYPVEVSAALHALAREVDRHSGLR
jgi:nicotinate phosphoribosyltransferase